MGGETRWITASQVACNILHVAKKCRVSAIAILVTRVEHNGALLEVVVGREAIQCGTVTLRRVSIRP